MSVIDQLLAGTLDDPDGGPPLAVPSKSVVIAESLAGVESLVDRVNSLAGQLAELNREIAIEGERFHGRGLLGGVVG